jgi:hypothetical protein
VKPGDNRLPLVRFAALEKSGQGEKLAASADLAGVQEFSDQEIKDAIEELNRSTDAITKQTETLKQQQDALGKLLNANAKDREARVDLEALQTHRSDAERKAISLAVSSRDTPWHDRR